MMTIKELKEKIKDLPDDMLIGNTGHFGEYLECRETFVHKAEFQQVYCGSERYNPRNFKDIFCICIEDKGEEPD